MAHSADVTARVRELLESQRLAVLATHGESGLHASLVAFQAMPDMRGLVFVTGRATRKFANLQKDDRAAMLIDNRSHGSADFRRAMALTARGRAREVSEEQRAPLLRAYGKRFPFLTDFALAPGCVLMCLKVESFSLVRHFQEVTELQF